MADLPELNRARRGHAFYPGPDEALPRLYATESTAAPDKLIVAHYFVGACDWWLAEYDPETGTGFGYACLGDPSNAEWGYVPLTQLEPITLPGVRAVVERDLHWRPKPWRDVRHPCHLDNR